MRLAEGDVRRANRRIGIGLRQHGGGGLGGSEQRVPRSAGTEQGGGAFA